MRTKRTIDLSQAFELKNRTIGTQSVNRRLLEKRKEIVFARYEKKVTCPRERKKKRNEQKKEKREKIRLLAKD